MQNIKDAIILAYNRAKMPDGYASKYDILRLARLSLRVQREYYDLSTIERHGLRAVQRQKERRGRVFWYKVIA